MRAALLMLACAPLSLGGCGNAGLGGSLDAGAPDLTRVHDLAPPPPPPPDFTIPLRPAGDHPPGPDVTTGGGPVIAKPDIVTVVWKGDSEAQRRADFGTWIAGSEYLDLLSEYGCGRGVAHGPYFIQTPPPLMLDDSQVGPLLRARIAAGDLPPPHTDILYVVYLDSSTSSTLDGMAGCTSYGGYHATMSTGKQPSWAAYAIIPDCRTSADDETVVASHEIVEAMSDPRANAFRDFALPYGEIGDLCTSLHADYDAGGTRYAVTRFGSEKNAAATTVDPCVPVPAAPYAYFNAALDPITPTITLDQNNRGTVVLNIEPFAFSPSINRISWHLWIYNIPGVSAAPSLGIGVPGSTQSITIKANAAANPGTWPIWITASAKGYDNVLYGALTVQ